MWTSQDRCLETLSFPPVSHLQPVLSLSLTYLPTAEEKKTSTSTRDHSFDIAGEFTDISAFLNSIPQARHSTSTRSRDRRSRISLLSSQILHTLNQNVEVRTTGKGEERRIRDGREIGVNDFL
jgi:hypothetical protein